MESSDPFTELIPSFPDELGLECLTRLPFPVHRFASRVSRRWRALMESQEFYHHPKKKKGYTHKLACLFQDFPREESLISNSPKRNKSPSFRIIVFNLADKSWQRLNPVASCKGKLVVMGRLDPISYDPVTDLGESMPTKRSFFAIGSHSGRVYVAGGHDKKKNALDSWTELTRMSQGRDECVRRVMGGEFWVVSGLRDGEPRGGKLDAAVGVWTCGVELGTRSLVSGSAYQGGTYGFYMVELKEGQIGKLEKVSVPDEFSRCVRSGCCVEV
ncbi:hypothetical protein UlMin_033294 [Ulmus minor]